MWMVKTPTTTRSSERRRTMSTSSLANGVRLSRPSFKQIRFWKMNLHAESYQIRHAMLSQRPWAVC